MFCFNCHLRRNNLRSYDLLSLLILDQIGITGQVIFDLTKAITHEKDTG